MGSGADFMDNEEGPVFIPKRNESALDRQVDGSHYMNLKIQPIEYCHHNKLGPCETLAIKYITRHGCKNGKRDVLKAIHSLELLIEMEYGDE